MKRNKTVIDFIFSDKKPLKFDICNPKYTKQDIKIIDAVAKKLKAKKMM